MMEMPTKEIPEFMQDSWRFQSPWVLEIPLEFWWTYEHLAFRWSLSSTDDQQDPAAEQNMCFAKERRTCIPASVFVQTIQVAQSL